MQAKLFLSIQSATERVLYYRSLFEHHYYNTVHYYGTDTRSKINFTTAFISSAFIGYIFNILLTTWKPMYQWSIIEMVGIGYFAFQSGSKIGENIIPYLERVSEGRFNHNKYNFKPIKSKEGDSYLNPIDLTQESSDDEDQHEHQYKDKEEIETLEQEAIETLSMLSHEKQIKTE